MYYLLILEATSSMYFVYFNQPWMSLLFSEILSLPSWRRGAPSASLSLSRLWHAACLPHLSSSTGWLLALTSTMSISTSLLETLVYFFLFFIFIHIDFFFFNLLGILIRAHGTLTCLGISSFCLRGWRPLCDFTLVRWDETNVYSPDI